MKPVLIDCDAGVDDAVALILALRSPELCVKGITTVSGNVHVDLCTENVLRVLDILDLPSPPPVAKGAAKPLARALYTAPEVHGTDGLGGLHSMRDEAGNLKYPRPALSPIQTPASEFIVRLASEYTNQLTIITLGPLTNIAEAIVREPDLIRRVHRIICMAGAFRTYGNTTTVAEFNAFVDPDALDTVVKLGGDLTFVPLDVTEKVWLKADDVERRIRPLGTRLSEFLSDVLQGYIKYHVEVEGLPGCFLHDPLAVAVAIDATLVTTIEGHVEIETDGRISRGMTVCDLRPKARVTKHPNARICLDVDSTRFLELLLQRILG